MTTPDVSTGSDTTDADAVESSDSNAATAASDEPADANDAPPENTAAPADSTNRTTIRAGRNFETTYRLDASETGEFLIALGEQLRAGDELTLVADEWELPFAFGEPTEVEIDFDGMDGPELEIELDIPGRTDDTAPRVE